jgi:hypothetical protein
MVGHIVCNGKDAIMESLVGYGSDDESGENIQDTKVSFVKICIVPGCIYFILYKGVN